MKKTALFRAVFLWTGFEGADAMLCCSRLESSHYSTWNHGKQPE
jgi:hypothetical protein